MPVTDLSIPCSLAVRYTVCDYRTKTVNSFVRYSQTMSHRCVQAGYIKTVPNKFSTAYLVY